MTIRSEVELALRALEIPIALEAMPFDKPSQGAYLEVFFLDPSTSNPTVDGERVRRVGTFQINCYVLDGFGMGELEELTSSVAALFPFHNKARYQSFSVEQTPNVSSSWQEGIYRVAAVRVKYRQEF